MIIDENKTRDIQVNNRKTKEVINLNYEILFSDILKEPFRHQDYYVQAQSVIYSDPSERTQKDMERYSKDYNTSYLKWSPRVISILKNDKNSRQAVIKFNSYAELQPCLISLQFLIRDNTLNVIGTWRSMEVNNFYNYDMVLVKHIVDEINQHFNLQLGTLYVNIGSAHIYVD